MATASLILGIICFLVSFSIFKDFSLICGVIAIVLGIIAIVKKNGKGMAIVGIILSVIGFVVLSSESISSKPSANVATAKNGENTYTGKTAEKTNYTLGDTFTFDGFQFTIGTEISYKTLNNQYADHNGATVIALPVTVVNNNSETKSVNIFYLKYFGSQGTQIDNVDAYFDDTAITDKGELRPGAKTSGFFYLLYDGNGKYGIDFDNFSEKYTLEFNVEK